MKGLQKVTAWGLGLMIGCTVICSSCGTSQSGRSSRGAQSASVQTVDPLTPAQRRKYDYFFREAVRLKEKEDYAAAFEMYRRCLDIDSNGAAALFELARFYMSMGQADQGERMLVKAVKQAPSHYWYNQYLALYYRNAGQTEKAIEVYEGLAKQSPSRVDPLYDLVDLYTRTKQYDKVIRTLDRVEVLDGKSEQLSMEKFRIYLQQDDKKQAFAEIQNLVDEYPYDMRYPTILANAYLDNQREEDAYALYQHVLAEEPGYVPAMIGLADYYDRQGADSLYQAQLDAVLKTDEVDSESKVNIMRQLILRSEQGDKDSLRMASIFSSVLAQPQKDANLAMLASQYYLTKQMQDSARVTLQQVLDLDPENIPARLQLVQFAISKQDMDELVRVCTPAVEYTPEVLEFYYYLGLAHHQKGETEAALEVFQKGVAQVNDQSNKALVSDLYAIMGDLYHIRKMQPQAYEAYDSALVYNADNIGALNNYAYYLSLEKTQLDRAEEMSYRTVKAEPNNGTYLDTYAWILFEKSKFTEAKIYIDQALTNGGDTSSVVVEHAGDIYYQNGDREQALAYWQQALKLYEDEAAQTEGASQSSDSRTEAELKCLKRKIAQKKYLVP
jgi:tetratricopeptide (TPR) repeat protein